VVVVTRYFGGTKLGTGGLVRAYSDAVRAVLEIVPQAERVPTHTVMAVYPYNFVERVRLLVAAHRGQVLEEDFAGDVTLTARFPVELLDGFQGQLSELTAGKVRAEIIESGEVLMRMKR
jgi:putative IMPACT (imprinted ancient) family translation regulator